MAWKKPETKVVVEPPRDMAKEFIKAFLEGGPIARTLVYRETENAGLGWEDVKRAFGELNGREYVQRGEHFWRIMPE
jgi:hypothetical protein